MIHQSASAVQPSSIVRIVINSCKEWVNHFVYKKVHSISMIKMSSLSMSPSLSASTQTKSFLRRSFIYSAFYHGFQTTVLFPLCVIFIFNLSPPKTISPLFSITKSVSSLISNSLRITSSLWTLSTAFCPEKL